MNKLFVNFSKRTAVFLGLISLLLTGVAPLPSSAAEVVPVAVTGHVMSSSSGDRLDGFTVYATRTDATGSGYSTFWAETNEIGLFDFGEIDPGNYRLQVWQSGVRDGSVPLYLDRQIQFTVGAEPIYLKVSLDPYPTGDRTLTTVILPNELGADGYVWLSLHCVTEGKQTLSYHTSKNIQEYGQPLELRFTNLPAFETCSLHGGGWSQNRSSLTFRKSISFVEQPDPLAIELKMTGVNTFSGRITSAQDDSVGVPYARVWASLVNSPFSWSSYVTADSSGYYSFDKVPLGSIRINVQPTTTPGPARNYYPLDPAQEFAVGGSLTSMNIALEPFPNGQGRVVGSVKDLDGAAIEGAQVTFQLIEDEDNTITYQATPTVANGNYDQQDLRAGSYRVSVSHPNYLQMFPKTIQVTDDELYILNFRLSPQGASTLTGTLKDSITGEPVDGVRLNFWFHNSTSGAYWWGSALTDSEGQYRLENAPAGTIEVYSDGKNRYFSFYGRKLVVTEGENSNDLGIEPFPLGSSTVTGVLKNANSLAPISGAIVSLECGYKRIHSLSYQIETDESGSYTFSDLAPGLACQSYVNSQGMSEMREPFDYERQFIVGTGETRIGTRYFLAPSANTLSGRLYEVAGLELPAGSVEATLQYITAAGASIWVGSAQINSDGTYQISGIPEYTRGAKLSLRVSDSNAGDDVVIFNSWSSLDLEYHGASLVVDAAVKRLPLGPGSVEGIVTDSLTGQPLEGIYLDISISSRDEDFGYADRYKMILTGPDGRYALAGIPTSAGVHVGAYDSRSPRLYRGANSYFDATPTQPQKVRNFALVPKPQGAGSVSGTLRDPDGAPLGEQQILLRSRTDSDFRSYTNTDTYGAFYFGDLPKGSYYFEPDVYGSVFGRAEFKNVPTAERSFTLATSSSRVDNFDLRIARYPIGQTVVSGQLWDETNGMPLSNVNVSIEGDVRNFPGANTFTDAEGNWRVEGMASGNFTIRYWSEQSDVNSQLPDFATITVTGSEPDSTLNIGRVLANPVAGGQTTVEITVVDSETYLPIQGASIYFSRDESNFQRTLEGGVGADGKVTYSNLQAGNYYLYSGKEGYWGAETEFKVTGENESKKVKLLVKKKELTGVIDGRVVDEWGSPIADAEVSVMHDIAFRHWGGDEVVSVRSDENGYFYIRGAPIDRTFRLSVYAPDGSNFAGYSEQILFNREDSTVSNKQIVLTQGATVTGRLAPVDGIEYNRFFIRAIERGTGRVLSHEYVGEDQHFTLNNLPATEVDLFVSDSATDWGTGFDGLGSGAFGYLRRTSASSAILDTQSSAQTKIVLAGGAVYDLGTIAVQAGASIEGVVSVLAGSVPVTTYSKQIRASLYRKEISGWVDMSNLVYAGTDGWSGGFYSLRGLPDGEYKVLFSEPWPQGEAVSSLYYGQKSSLAEATVIKIENGQSVTGVNVTLSVPAPVSAPAVIAPEALKTELEDSVTVAGNVAAGSDLVVSVGEAFVGTWVAVTTETAPATVAPAQLRSANLAFRSAAATNPSSATSGWKQVRPDGTLSVRVSSAGETKVIVQDVNNNVIGWTSVTVAAATITDGGSSGGGGGGGGGSVEPVVPTVKTAPVLNGKIALNEILVVDNGTWTADWPLTYSYRWFRCDSAVTPAIKLAEAKGCIEIPAQIAKWHMVTEADLDKHIVVEVTASDGANSGVYVTGSISAAAVKPLELKLTKKTKVSGVAKVGKALVASTPIWSADLKPTTVKFRWYRCSTSVKSASTVPAKCVAIPKAVSSKYRLTKADAGKYVTIMVTGVNGKSRLSYTPGVRSKVKP